MQQVLETAQRTKVSGHWPLTIVPPFGDACHMVQQGWCGLLVYQNWIQILLVPVAHQAATREQMAQPLGLS